MFITTLVRSVALAALCAVACRAPVHGASFALPSDGSTMVGRVQVVTDIGRNTLLDIARHYDLGYEEIVNANPGVSVWVPPPNGRIVVPTQFILPGKPWTGIVINIPQRRLYYFPEPKKGEARQVVTYPLGIARERWPTPLGQTAIVAKYRDPAWLVPHSIREEARAEGEPALPSYVPPGPDNPMGMHALRTGFRGIFLHGTNRPWGVGMRVSHGCLHLYPEDAAELFARVRVGTPVRIVNERYVVGVTPAGLFGASFEAVDDYPAKEGFAQAVLAVVRATDEEARAPAVDWRRVYATARGVNIIPIALSATDDPADDPVARITAEPYAHAPYGVDANGSSPPSQLARVP